jgi:hypothetical protein
MNEFATKTDSTQNASNAFELLPPRTNFLVSLTQPKPLDVGFQGESHVRILSKKRRSIPKQAKEDIYDCNHTPSNIKRTNVGSFPMVSNTHTDSHVIDPANNGGCNRSMTVRPHRTPDQDLLASSIDKLLDIADRIPFVGVKTTDSKVSVHL